MSILSDTEITELCTPPKFAITTMLPVKGAPGSFVHYHPQSFTSYSYQTKEELDDIIERNKNIDVGIKSYRELTEEEIAHFKPMISPFVDHQVRVNENGEKVISYGVSSSGYDLRIAPEFMIFSNVNSVVVDPKKFDERSFVKVNANEIVIPPNSFVLARSLEHFDMPKDVCGVVVGKSTLARVGINCLVTPLEVSWSGYLTLEFANTTSLPVKLYANEGGCQVQFFKHDTPPAVTYASRNGKYSNQAAEITLPRV